MLRVPINVLGNLQLSTSLADTNYDVPANQYLTISAATLNNTTGTARTATANVIPSGGAAAAANEVVSALGVPVAGSAPTIVSALIGQTLGPGAQLQFKADAATAVTVLVSGYLTSL